MTALILLTALLLAVGTALEDGWPFTFAGLVFAAITAVAYFAGVPA